MPGSSHASTRLPCCLSRHCAVRLALEDQQRFFCISLMDLYHSLPVSLNHWTFRFRKEDLGSQRALVWPGTKSNCRHEDFQSCYSTGTMCVWPEWVMYQSQMDGPAGSSIEKANHGMKGCAEGGSTSGRRVIRARGGKRNEVSSEDKSLNKSKEKVLCIISKSFHWLAAPVGHEQKRPLNHYRASEGGSPCQ